MRILGIDYGSSKIGLAIGDTDVKVASPLEVVKLDTGELEYIKALVKSEDIEMIVLGIPYGGNQQQVTQAFYVDLYDTFDIPVIEYDERFTTSQASKLMFQGNMKGDDDAIAAMVMLQGYLDSLEV